MPSSLAGVLSRACGYSPRPPVSVSGTGTPSTCAEAFLGSLTAREFGTRLPSPSRLSLPELRDFPPSSASPLGRASSCALPSASCVPPAPTHLGWHGILHPFPIGYAFRPRLRSRLTLGGRTFPRKPWASGGQDSHLSYRYSRRQSHYPALHEPSQVRFPEQGTLPYRTLLACPTLRWRASAPLHFPRSRTRPVSCYALFKRWLLLSQRPGCLRPTTAFPT